MRTLQAFLIGLVSVAVACSQPPADSASRPPIPSQGPATNLASLGDAFISQNTDASAWTIGNVSIRLSVGFDQQNNLQVIELVNPKTGRGWDLARAADATVTISGRQWPLGSREAGFVFEGAHPATTEQGVQLALSFSLPRDRARVTRYYACYPGAPVIETWTVFAASGAQPITVSSLNCWQLTIGAGPVHWVTGLEAPDADGGPFTLRRRTLGPGDRLELGAQGRSSQYVVPWLSVDSAADEFFGGIMWSGSWAVSIERQDARLRVTAGLPEISTSVQEGNLVETPHGFFGMTPGTQPEAAAALRSFIQDGVRGGRPFAPLVTYNTWFSYGTRVDETAMHDEMGHAARLGAELFVLDAGWYAGPDEQKPYDFTPGLGSWTADPRRFPSGLASLATYARSRGLRFGIWVEPERVALSTVGQPGLALERWLATTDGRYDLSVPQNQAVAAQICLADPQARQWVLDRLVQLIDGVHADYLKWDNNFWINCNRPGHGHGAADGNFAHVRGLYAILAQLRGRYPDLLIENVSGGGRRLDLGMMRYTDAAWMDDRSSPSALVRHNLEGLSTVFPPAYLLSFVMNDAPEPVHDGSDLPLYVRSRMPGMLGLAFRGALLSESEEAQLTRAIGIYKNRREILRDGTAVLLTDQASPGGGPPWDVIEEVSTTGDATIFAFRTDPAAGRVSVRPKNLEAGATYEIESVDSGTLGSMTGATLMNNGLVIPASPNSASQVLILTKQLRTQMPEGRSQE